MSDGANQNDARRDLWIPGLFVAFFVGLAILQGWFVYIAQSSFAGLVTDQQMQADSAGPDWRVELDFIQHASLKGVAELIILDERRARLDTDMVTATIERGTRFPQSLPVVFSLIEPGRYSATIELPLAGPWTVRMLITEDGRTIERIATIEVSP